MTRRGVSLVELLIAIVLTGIATFITISLLSTESGHFQRTREKIRMQADARDAMRILEEELRNAGYNARITATSRVRSVPVPCTEVAFSATGEALRTGMNGTTMAGGDSLSFRFYELPASGVLTTCGTGSASRFREISYRLDGGRLERRYRDDPAATAAWIPFLDNVVSFQVRYGLLSQPVDTPAGMNDAAMKNGANWSKFAIGAQTITGTATSMTLSGFDNSNTVDAHFALPVDSVRKGEIYRCSFDATPNAPFLDSVNGYDTNATRLAFMTSTSQEKDQVYFKYPMVAGVTQHYDIYLTGPGTANNHYYVAVKNKLMAGANTGKGQQVRIENFTIRRVNRTRYFRWLSSPTAEEMAQVGAVRINLLVKTPQSSMEPTAPTFTPAQLGDTTLPAYTATGADAKRSHLLYERVIPVVNNAI